MAGNYKESGVVIMHTPAAAVADGQVVRVGAVLGVALVDIAANQSGVVRVNGVFEVPKVAGTAIAQGSQLVFKAATSSFAASNAATVAGDVTGLSAFAWKAAAAGDTKMEVCFTGVPGVVV